MDLILRVELGVLLSGDRKHTEESENPTGDRNAAPEISHAVQGNASGRLNVDALSQRSKGENLEPTSGVILSTASLGPAQWGKRREGSAFAFVLRQRTILRSKKRPASA